MVIDSIADALIRIKNGYMSKKSEVVLNYSKIVIAICDILLKEGYIAEAKYDGKREILVKLKYDNRQSALSDVRRISKPGLRVYKNKKSLPWVLNGMGIAIISTPKGLMTDKQARKNGLGGEVMAYVW